MKLSLIITTYNWPDALELVLKSVENQTIFPNEVIIADDGSGSETREVIQLYKKKSRLNIIHSWQDDLGFRVSRSRNKAILNSSGDYIVLVDGDMILHPNFIKDHLSLADIGYFVQGSRVLLSKSKTKKIIRNKNINLTYFSLGIKNRKNAIYSKLLSLFFKTVNKNIKGIRSCNMAFYRNDFFNINGFNNDFEGWGREDSELVVRLLNSGIYRKNIHFNAIQFHLWHNENARESLQRNNLILESTIEKSSKWIENGIDKINNNED
jgi:glycosyltransferase involved in cell wall biosynthesis